MQSETDTYTKSITHVAIFWRKKTAQEELTSDSSSLEGRPFAGSAPGDVASAQLSLWYLPSAHLGSSVFIQFCEQSRTTKIKSVCWASL